MEDQLHTDTDLLKELQQAHRRIGDLEEANLSLHQQQEVLTGQKAFLEALVNSLPDMIFAKDANFRMTLVNDAFCERTGAAREDILGKTAFALYPKEIAEIYQSKDEELLKSGQINRNEEWIVGRTGIRALLDTIKVAFRGPEGELRGIMAVSRDITERKQTEEALQKSARRFRVLFEQAGVGVAEIDTASGRFVKVNQKYCDILGLTSDEMEKLTFKEITHPDDLQEDLDQMKALVEGRTREFSMEKRYCRKDGSILWVDLTVSPMWAPGESPTCHIAVVQDITERRQAEEGLRESEERFRRLAEENARLLEQARHDAETKTTLLEEVNHRVKNNLTGIIGLLHVHERFAKGRGPFVFEGIMKELVNRVEGLAFIHRMLSSTEWAPMSLHHLATEVSRFSLKSLPTDKHVKVDVDSRTLLVSAGQASHLALVLNELVTNTVKHAFADRHAACVTIKAARKNGSIRITYQDDGAGYSEEVLRCERRAVGLYLVENIVKSNLRGVFRLYNNPGAGAEITLKQTA